MTNIMDLWNSTCVLQMRRMISRVRHSVNPFYKRRVARQLALDRALNEPFESGLDGFWRPQIMTIESTLRYVIDHHVSVSRFGDGEFEMIASRKKEMTFQKYEPELRNRLCEVLDNPIPECLACIINVFGSLSSFSESDQIYWRHTVRWMRPLVEDIVKKHPQVLGDPQISRPYMPFLDRVRAEHIFQMWKSLFRSRDLLIVEGRYSRLGVGNDLLDGAKRIRRIWCPPENAFTHYDRIFQTVCRNASREGLVLLALGHTASVLAYDLAKAGYWAIDIGHLDVEYIWMKLGVKEKVAIPGRYVNEAADGHEMISYNDEEQMCHVIAKVGC